MIDLRNWGATEAEVVGPMPGDGLLAEAPEVGTRSIDLAADPELVFGYLAQMGFGKAGWYSYDWLDNLGRRSARTVRPEWAVTSPGETVPGGPIEFRAEVVDRPRALVLAIDGAGALGHRVDFTLAYDLRPIAAGTRLVSRVRLRVDGPGGRLASRLLLLGDGVMVRRQLLGLAERCHR